MKHRLMIKMLAVCTFLVILARVGAAEKAEWHYPFDGKTFNGWTKRGGKATYEIRDGAIVGTTVPRSRNTFLCTSRDYSDFILELEFKIDSRMNSGVQIRSASIPSYHKGVVHGYQVEIDPSDRAWSGGIYDESRRGWINNLKGNDAARAAFKKDDWNHYRVEAIGDHIKTFVNGVPAADLRDSLSLSGFIALQVHGTNSEEPMEIVWRNIRIQDLGKHTWKPLFDGRSLSGWKALPGGEWSVVDGVITGISEKAEKRHGLLMSDSSFSDFTVRLKFRVKEGDSGFYFRAEPVKGAVGVHGFQVELDTSYETGGLYETGGRAWVVHHPADKKTRWYKQGEWNDLTVSAHGQRTVVHMNGRKSAELVDDPGRLSGRLALQLHGGQDMHVEFKDIEQLIAGDSH